VATKHLQKKTQTSPRETKNPAKTHFLKDEYDFSHLSLLPKVTWKRVFLALASETGQENAKTLPLCQKSDPETAKPCRGLRDKCKN
jgi:hypothetical protein